MKRSTSKSKTKSSTSPKKITQLPDASLDLLMSMLTPKEQSRLLRTSRQFSQTLRLDESTRFKDLEEIQLSLNDKLRKLINETETKDDEYHRKFIDLVLIGANPNVILEDNDLSKIGMEIYLRNNDFIKFLIDNGLDINVIDNTKFSLLMNALVFNNVPVAEMLLDAGVNPNLRGNYGQTALHIAIQNRTNNIIQKLLDKGANPYVKDKYGQTAFDVASLKNNLQAKRILDKYRKDTSRCQIQ